MHQVFGRRTPKQNVQSATEKLSVENECRALTKKHERRLVIIENKILRTIFEPTRNEATKEWTVRENGELK